MIYICSIKEQKEIKYKNQLTNRMSRIIKFTKMHGSGNDYIYVNTLLYPISDPEKLSIIWSKYHTGIGSDGLVLIGKSDIADFSMRIFNADGSEAMMCGNASRCIGKYVYDYHLTDKKEVRLETLSGIKILKLITENDKVTKVTVDMGKPEKELVSIDNVMKELIEFPIKIQKETYLATAISMGNPHLVIFVEDIETIDLPKIGPMLENYPLFPNRINVEFVQILTDKEVRMRVWERGSGITQACGTGACATAVAGILTNKLADKVLVKMDGGALEIEWDTTKDKVYMTGDAVKVFDGEIEIDN